MVKTPGKLRCFLGINWLILFCSRKSNFIEGIPRHLRKLKVSLISEKMQDIGE